MDKLQKLIEKTKCGVSIEINGHRDYYETIDQYIEPSDKKNMSDSKYEYKYNQSKKLGVATKDPDMVYRLLSSESWVADNPTIRVSILEGGLVEVDINGNAIGDLELLRMFVETGRDIGDVYVNGTKMPDDLKEKYMMHIIKEIVKGKNEQ